MQVQPEKEPDQVVEAKPPLLTRLKNALMHYYHGFRLLFLELRITARLLGKTMKGKPLSRREKKQVKLSKSNWIEVIPNALYTSSHEQSIAVVPSYNVCAMSVHTLDLENFHLDKFSTYKFPRCLAFVTVDQ